MSGDDGRPLSGANQRVVIGVDVSRLATAARTGTEQYLAHLMPALVEQAGDQRWRFYINRPLQPAPPWLAAGETRVIPWPRLWTHLRLAAELRAHPPSLLFVPAHVVPLACPVPAVVTIHDLGYLAFPAAHPPAARLYLNLSTRWSVQRARRVIAISQATKQALVQHYRVPPERIDVVYHGVAPRFRPPADPAATRATVARLGIREPYLLAVGTVQPRKNYGRLIAALAQLRAEGWPHQLVIVGRTGWLAAETLAAPARHGLASQVLFAGYLPDEVLPDLYSRADCVVMPSLYEGLGMPVAEALACGAPVVCARTTALPEVGGAAVVYCNPLAVASLVDGIREVIANPARRAALVRAGPAQAAQFTWERCAQSTLATLRAAL